MSADNWYPNERLVEEAGVSLLVHQQQGEPGEPLVVFLPGAIHLARVAYGHPGCRPEDFLAHWVAEKGWSFLAVSYPLDLVEPVFDDVDPDLGLAAFARAVAGAIDTMKAAGDPSSVTVLGWSAAGNIAPRLRTELESRGIQLELFVALAATPAIPGLIFGSAAQAEAWASAEGSFTKAGLLAHEGLRSFLPELVATDRRYGRTVIGQDVYERQYLGDMPLNLFPGLDVQRQNGRVVQDYDGPLAESRANVWAEYPLVASLQPTWVTDARHAVTDRHNWGLVVTNTLQASLVDVIGGLSEVAWQTLATLISSAPERLNRVIEGGHMFFVGDEGAKETIDIVAAMRNEAALIRRELAALTPN